MIPQCSASLAVYMLRAVRPRREYWPEHGLFSGLRNILAIADHFGDFLLM